MVGLLFVGYLMPELPEVETVVRGLRHPLVERTFISAQILWPNTLKTPTIPEFEARLPGQRIEAITRRAKYLQFHLSHGDTLFIHLKMSGNILVEPTDKVRHHHVRAVLGLDNGHELRFKDMRKFGRLYLTAEPMEVIGKLGPEPLADEFTVEQFKALFEKRRGRLKPTLLKQEVIAGIGNIYADESCFIAQLDPRRPVDSLNEAELTRLYTAIRQALTHGIIHKGASLDAVYQGGEFQNHFQAYGRTHQPCGRCGTEIQRIVLGGRSTHFCPNCQQ